MALCRRPSPLVVAVLAVAPAALAQTRWSQVTPSLPFYGQGTAVYDPLGQRSIVVNHTSNTTWQVASMTGVWTQLTQQSGGPGWLVDASLAYDTNRQRAVLFGGETGAVLDTTWELVGSTWQVVPTAVTPPARRDAGMCFDATTGLVVLAGGDAASAGAASMPLSDIWTFDGTAWTAVAGSGPAGPTVMAYDSDRGVCVALAANGTFEWQSVTFVQVPTAVAPPPRGLSRMVYDSLRERIVLFGGNDGSAASLGDVWEYANGAWTQRQPLGDVPRRERHAMVYDPVLDVVRVFAGIEKLIALGGVVTTSFLHADDLHYGPVSPPVVKVFALGCYFPATLWADGLPWLGDSIDVTMPVSGTGLPPLFAFGESNLQWGGVPLPIPLDSLGFPNCELVVAPDIVLAPSVAAGTATLTIPIPNQPGLLGAQLFAQGFEPDLAGAGTGSNGLQLRLGGR